MKIRTQHGYDNLAPRSRSDGVVRSTICTFARIVEYYRIETGA